MFNSTKCMSTPRVTGRVSPLSLLVSLVLCTGYVYAQVSDPKTNTAGEFTLTGTVMNPKAPYLYLIYRPTPDVEIKDSSSIADGKFEFKGIITEPTRATLRENSSVFVNGKVIADETNLNITLIYLEKGAMTAHLVQDDFKSIRLTGSKTQQDQDEHNRLLTPFSKQYETLRDQLAQAKGKNYSQQQIDSLKGLADEAIKGLRSTTYRFILNHPDSYFSANELNLYKNFWPYDSVKYLFEIFSPEIKGSSAGVKINEVLRAKEMASVGAMAAEFSGQELNGQQLKLSDFKGKYVLVDFWGSWCGPCREGNPHLIEVYNKYKDKDFEIIGVASNDNDLAWRKAVEKDRIGIWKQIMDTDTESRGTAIAHTYGVFSYPTKVLVDKSGKIIGRFGGNDGKKLDDLLARTLE